MSFDLSVLGIEKNIPKIDFKEYTGMFAAPEKFGKTTFATLYPNNVILAAEIGYKAKVANVKQISDWDSLVEFVDMLEDNREAIGDNIQTITIDTIDELYKMVAPYVCRQQTIKDGEEIYNEIKDIPYGQGWNYWDEEFKKQLDRILNMGFTLFYLTHTEVKTVRPKNGEPYEIYVSTMPDRCKKIIYPACDYILWGERCFINENGVRVPKRMITGKANEMAVAGSRVFLEEDIVFDTEEEAMEKFQVLFRRGVEKELKKHGITTDIEQLEKEQKEERQKAIKKHIEETRNDLNQFREKISKEVVKQMESGKTGEWVMAILNKHGVDSPQKIKSIDTANAILEELKNA